MTPVDEENMEGLRLVPKELLKPIPVMRIKQVGSTGQAENPADAGAHNMLKDTKDNGDYEKTEETINYEINRIHKEMLKVHIKFVI